METTGSIRPVKITSIICQNLSFSFSDHSPLLLNSLNFELKVDNIYSDTGIALIGMVALIFSLNTYKQQILYKYMNSVMDKILNDKKYDILQYIVVAIIAILFIFMSNIICNNYISTSIYICCLTYIFIYLDLI